MGSISDTLGRQLAIFAAAHAPTRVLVGGLPDFVIESIGQTWAGKVDLLLVSEPDPRRVPLPSGVRRCRPDDLTAARQDSWVALVHHSQSRGIQESIRSAGAGTVREVWQADFPWTPCNLPGARFRDVINEWVRALALESVEGEVRRCIRQFRDELKGEVDACAKFFGALDRVPIAAGSYDEICFSAGFPRHDAGSVLRRRGDKTTVLACLDEFVGRFREDGPADASREFKDAAATIADPVARSTAEAAIESFASGFRTLEPIDSENSVRAWRGALAGRRGAWDALNHSVLRQLLGVEPRAFAIAHYELRGGIGTQIFDVGETRVIARDRNAAASLTGLFTLNADLAKEPSLRLFSKVAGSAKQQVGDIPPGTGPHELEIKLRGTGRHSIRFSIGPNSTTDLANSTTSVLWECSEEYPLIVGNARAKIRPGRRRRTKADPDGIDYFVDQNVTVPFQGPAALQCFIYDLNGPLKYEVRGVTREVTGLQDLKPSKVKQFSLALDVVDGGEVDFSWVDNEELKKHRATISFSVKGEPGPRNDSMSGALVDAHRRAHSRVLQEAISSVKTGDQLRADDLPLKPSLKPIQKWEVRQQAASNGWWPILVDDRAGVNDQDLVEKKSFVESSRLRLNEQANAWKSALAATLPGIPAVVEAYVAARARLLEALGRQFVETRSGAAAELRLARQGLIGFVGDDLVEAHCRSYVDMLGAANAKAISAEWQWRAYCADTVVAFSENGTEPSATLLGPFHPISIARNHGLQRCLGERIVAGQSSDFALLLAQVPPLFTGRVLDSQQQLADAICFPSGDLAWVFLYRQVSSKLPTAGLVDWLQRVGLDPSVGPLGVDPEILPETMRHYSLAYPGRRNLTMLLDDFSQASFQILRDDVAAGGEGKRTIRDMMPGTLRVFADKGRLERVEGELISYDPDLPLLWHNSAPPDTALVDIATLPKSNHVDFAVERQHGAFSSAMPTVRRPLVQHSTTGLKVAGGMPAARSSTGLPGAVVDLIRCLEPEGRVLAWGSSLIPTEPLKARWTLCSAGQVDARLFIDYVISHPNTALWTYRLFSVNSDGHAEFGRGHFLLARVSQALAKGLETLLSAVGLPITPAKLMQSLAKAGLTLGDEFLRTGRAAEGALGQFLIERLVWGDDPGNAALPHWTRDANGGVVSAGFILQVDPIKSILDSLNPPGTRAAPEEAESNQRSDLVAFDVRFCDDELWIHPTVMESKFFASGTTSGSTAFLQAEVTASKLSAILERCIVDPSKGLSAAWAQPERILVADIIHLGLRLARGTFDGPEADWSNFEARVLSCILSGDFHRTDTEALAIVHHVKATSDHLSAADAHAYVAISDAAAALSGRPPKAYDEIRAGLAAIVRHECNAIRTLRAPATSPATEVPAPLRPTIIAPGAQVAQPSGAPLPGPAPSQGQMDLGRAHDAFDAAFADFIGNRAAIEKLRDDLVDALTKRPPHLASAYLLTGNPSTGKTTLANKVAKLLGVTFVKLVGTNIKSDKDLIEQVDNAFKHAGKPPEVTPAGSQGIPEHAYAECLIFIDEIHLVKQSAQEGLLTLTEPKDRYVRLRDRICKFPKATYMAATTRDSEIDKALRTRFGNPIHLNDYKPEEVAQMLAIKEPSWASWPEEVRLALANLSRCVPREAERLAQKLARKMTVAREPLVVSDAVEKLRLEEGLDRNGLDRVYWKALRMLAKQDRPVGREALAHELGITDSEKLVDEIIPKLRSMGLVAQQAGGQQITDRGRLYLRNESPPSGD